MNDEEHEKHFLKKTAKELNGANITPACFKPMEQSFPRLN